MKRKHGFSGTAYRLVEAARPKRKGLHGFSGTGGGNSLGLQAAQLLVFGFSGTRLGLLGTIFGFLGTKRRVIRNTNRRVFRNRAFGFSGTRGLRKTANLHINPPFVATVTRARDLNKLINILTPTAASIGASPLAGSNPTHPAYPIRTALRANH